MAYNYVGKYLRSIWASSPRITNPDSTAANQYFGRTNLTAATAVVSTTLAKADSLFSLVVQNQSPVGSAGVSTAWGINTVAPGVGFTIGTVNSVSVTGSFTAHWILYNQS